jgi:hypothetical protein
MAVVLFGYQRMKSKEEGAVWSKQRNAYKEKYELL